MNVMYRLDLLVIVVQMLDVQIQWVVLCVTVQKATPGMPTNGALILMNVKLKGLVVLVQNVLIEMVHLLASVLKEPYPIPTQECVVQKFYYAKTMMNALEIQFVIKTHGVCVPNQTWAMNVDVSIVR